MNNKITSLISKYFKDKNKIIVIVLVIVAIIVFGMFIFSTNQKTKQEAAQDTNSEQSVYEFIQESSVTSTTSTEETKPVVINKNVDRASGAVSLDYSEALNKYSKSGYRIQIIDCRATPGTMTVKKGNTFMIDNRDAVSRKITVGTTVYNIKGYGFVIARAKVLGLNYIKCNNNRTATLNVEP